MQTARVTVLMTPERKAGLESDASQLGVSSGEYIRLAIDNYGEADQARELAALSREVEAAVPEMQAALERSIESLSRASARIDALLREQGLRR